jgi:hypothetical protein
MYAFIDRTSKFLNSKKGSLVVLIVIYLAFVVFTILSNIRNTYGPVHFDDEILYWNSAKSIFTGEFNAKDYHHYPPIYPIALLPAFYLFSSAQVYDAAKVLNVLYISSAIFPIYLISRQFLNKKVSLLVSILVLLLPTQVVIPRSIISENIFYPLFFWAIYLAFTDVIPDNHKAHNLQNILLGILSGLLVLTRYIGLAIVPCIWIIWWMKPSNKEKYSLLISKKKLIHAISIVIPFVILVGSWVLLGVRENVPMMDMLGFFIAREVSQLGAGGLVNWIIFYVSYASLIAAPYLGILMASISHLRLKNLQQPVFRWLISVILICIFFLIACIRHSYRASYNFPDPMKIQGRYILYFAPLFMITAFAAIKNIDFSKISRISRSLWIVIPSAIISMAYLILFGGFIILDSPLSPSVNSPDGYLFQSLDIIFPMAAIFISLIGVLSLRKNKPVLQIFFPLLLAGLYIFGAIKMYKSILFPRQLNNFQVYSLIQTVDLKYENQDDVRESELTLSVPPNPTYTVFEKWENTFYFRGFNLINIVEEKNLGGDNPVLLDVKVNNDHFVLRTLNKNEFDPENQNHVKYADNYYSVENISK